MKIALIGLSPLNTLGLTALIQRSFPDVDVCVADGRPHSPVYAYDWQQADGYIVSAAALATYARFLMSKLDRIVLLTTSAAEATEGGHNGIAMLSPLASTLEIQGTIAGIINTCKENIAMPTEAALTAREIDVLRCTAMGMTAKEAAAKLCISVNTVLTHRKSLSSKLGLRTASAITHYAMIHGLLP